MLDEGEHAEHPSSRRHPDSAECHRYRHGSRPLLPERQHRQRGQIRVSLQLERGHERQPAVERTGHLPRRVAYPQPGGLGCAVQLRGQHTALHLRRVQREIRQGPRRRPHLAVNGLRMRDRQRNRHQQCYRLLHDSGWRMHRELPGFQRFGCFPQFISARELIDGVCLLQKRLVCFRLYRRHGQPIDFGEMPAGSAAEHAHDGGHHPRS